MLILFFNTFSTGNNSTKLMPIILQNLNINNLRNTSAKTINLQTVRKLITYCLKTIVYGIFAAREGRPTQEKKCLLLPFLRYCCSKIGRYYHTPSRLQEAKGLKFQSKTKKNKDFVKIT